jgi:hypothetical protein
LNTTKLIPRELAHIIRWRIPQFSLTRLALPQSERHGAILYNGTPLKWKLGHHFLKWHSPNLARVEPPFINAQKMVVFSKKKVCFDLEMMGFFLQYDLGVKNNGFHSFKGFQHSTK